MKDLLTNKNQQHDYVNINTTFIPCVFNGGTESNKGYYECVYAWIRFNRACYNGATENNHKKNTKLIKQKKRNQQNYYMYP